MKQMNEQLATVFGNFKNGAASSSAVTNLAAMSGNTVNNESSCSINPNVKSDAMPKQVKQERDTAGSSRSPAVSGRAAKRQRTVVELD